MAILDFYDAENGLIMGDCIFACRCTVPVRLCAFRHKPVGAAVHASACGLFFHGAASCE
jgi:hypothetical protein